jgi:PhoH-like ATPase
MTTYVLDTSTLVCDPAAWKHFINSQVIIPITVLNELDKLKKLPNDTGKNARVCIRLLDEVSNLGDISTGILLDDGVLLKIEVANVVDKSFGPEEYGDTQILCCAYSYHVEFPNDNVTLVSNDINLRVKAKARGIEAMHHDGKKFSVSELYAGIKIVENSDAANDLALNNELFVDNYGIDLNRNECVFFEKENILGRKITDRIVKPIKKSSLWGIYPKNKEQTCAMDLILDKSVDLVTLTGAAGTGKTLVILAAALELVINKKEYNKFIIYRPIQPVGNDIGYLPGTLDEKLSPWFAAIMDGLEFLLSKNKDWKKDLELWQKKDLVEFGAITYVRGRSIPNAIVLIEEAQNISTDEIKTILTRAGTGTKVILNGDLDQIDRNDLDATNNGLIYVIEKFKNLDMAGHINFTQGERSRLATKAAEIL